MDDCWGSKKPFLVDIVDVVAEIFRQPYPDIGEKRDYIKKVIQLEEPGSAKRWPRERNCYPGILKPP